MAAGDAGLDGAGQVAFQVCKLRAGDMPFAEAALAEGQIFQGKAAIENQQVGLSKALLQLGGADQLGERHASHPVGKRAAPIITLGFRWLDGLCRRISKTRRCIVTFLCACCLPVLR